MKLRAEPAGLLVAAALFFQLLPLASWPVQAAGQPQCNCWLPQGPLVITVQGRYGVEADVTYYNGFAYAVTGTATLVVRNSLGDTVGTDNTTGTIQAGQNGTLHPTVGIGSALPSGNYSASVFATANGVVISEVSNGTFTVHTLPIQFDGYSSTFGGGPVTFTLDLTNLTPNPVTGTLYGFANDTTGRADSNASTAVSLSGNSQGTATLVFPATGGISQCFLSYTFVIRAPNGTALSPYDHEVGDDDIPSCYNISLPVSHPVSRQIGGSTFLEINVTDSAPFPVTLETNATLYDYTTAAEVATTNATVTIQPGQTAPADMPLVGLACEFYVVAISGHWSSPTAPPGGVNVAPISVRNGLQVCPTSASTTASTTALSSSSTAPTSTSTTGSSTSNSTSGKDASPPSDYYYLTGAAVVAVAGLAALARRGRHPVPQP